MFTYFGQYAGNFVMAITPESFQRGIILSDDKEFTAPTSRLSADPVSDAWDITYPWLNIEAAMNTDGNYRDPLHEYLAYTFYLQNTGNETVPVRMTLDIMSVHLNVDKAIRILLIENDTIYRMYQKPDDVETEYDSLPEALYFVSDTRVLDEVIQNFRPGQINKYTFLLWLEGEDPDCTNDVKGGRIKLQMNFKIEGGQDLT
ncbi:MAG: hypothetical protein ACOX5P_00570 [Bacilli bacterium]